MVHTNLTVGHPGIVGTFVRLKVKYWWPDMEDSVRRVVASCAVCASSSALISKVPCTLPVGKLMPLPTPARPWSHVAVDFVTDLPNSRSHTVVLVVVERFSKACRFILFAALPSATQVTKALFQQVFRHYGILEDIVLD